MSERWSAEDHALVVAEYATTDLIKLAKRLGRTVGAVERHAQKTGIKRLQHGRDGKCRRASEAQKFEFLRFGALQQAMARWVR